MGPDLKFRLFKYIYSLVINLLNLILETHECFLSEQERNHGASNVPIMQDQLHSRVDLQV